MQKNPGKPGRKGRSRSGGGAKGDGFRSRGMKGPPKDAPTRSRGQRTHGAVQAPRKPGSKPGDPQQKGRQKGPQKGSKSASGKNWIWGTHAVTAALANPRRTLHELWITEAAERRLKGATLPLPARTVEPHELDRHLPPGAVHQGLAVHAAPLEWPSLPTLADATDLVLVLDQVTDPHNLGAMFRLASAFGVGALILQDRNAPPLTGATAKVAVGCIETVPVVQVVNIANTLDELKGYGFECIGLAGETELSLAEALSSSGKRALAMGAEGRGLRPRVAATCDRLARIPMLSGDEPGEAESLNVATAAAIALYEARRD